MEGLNRLLIILFLLGFSVTVFAAEAESSVSETADEESTYTVIDRDDEDLLDGELTPAGEAALREAQANDANISTSTLRPEESALGQPSQVDLDKADELLAAQGLDADIQSLKEEVLILNRELFSLEEELLFPSNTQFAVYISVDVGEFFDMESVRVILDNKPVASYLYTKRESDALMRGGVHRVYMGNLTAGTHELIAYYTGRGPRGRDFKRATKRTVNKEIGPKYIELKISDSAAKKQSEFEVKEW